MRLSDALRIKAGQVVAFTGAGGKTSAIRKLVSELKDESPIIVTTTTKLGLDQCDLADIHLIVSASEELASLSGLIASNGSLLITGKDHPDEPKWLGLDMEQELERVTVEAQRMGALLLIEADGARGKSLKVPAAHEPVVPPWSDVVVPIAGLDVIGAQQDSEKVHRPARVAKFLGLGIGETISIDHIVRILSSSEAGLKGIPASVQVRIILNKAETDVAIGNGRALAQKLLGCGKIRSVLLANVSQDDPVREVIGRTAGIILAAGKSTRLEGPKQLLYWRGKPLIAYAIETACRAGLDPIIVVHGPEKDKMRAALAEYSVELVENLEAERGQSSSIALGMQVLADRAEAAVFLLADMPLVTADLVEALINVHRRTLAAAVAPAFKGQRGNPVLFDCTTFDALGKLRGDKGGRAIFHLYPPLLLEWDETALFDIDSPSDLEMLRSKE
jgi:molybdenum cofactor cytidylyltransferase